MDPTKRRIRKIDRDAQRFVAQALGNTDLSLSDYDMIHTVRHRPGVTQEELRRLYCLDKSTIARRAAKLEEAGYIRRRPSTEDKRRKELFVTEKGDALRHEAYALLKEAGGAGRINFTGNIEADAAMLGGADVIVADGYTGNIMLKSVEGVGKFLLKELKKVFLSSTKTKVAAALVKGDMAKMKKLIDPGEVGGTPFLGISRPVVKAHGSSDARAVSNAILRAVEYAESGLIADIENNINLMKVERNAEKN